MFDFGLWEITLIGVITLIVVGPERLPGIARKVGLYVGKLKNFVDKIKQDVTDELEAEKLKEHLTINEEDSGIVDIIKDTKETLSEVKEDIDKIKSNKS
ncbi:MAG TPA: twin-arginine translocase subunit TatB [Gammaproteobacteria bacterium]|nr:twin-arginine translocase subunit TatB [Gammaproteobacteria bacterium]|tara:strand:- start:2522 stop:2818 length:297 start_codon:yes stop_codon:yes gene_type:complete